jgi:protein-S-isoprenylcysteine O-methyltransferase Ste14
MPSQVRDTAGVAAPPPLIYLGAIVIGAALERVWRWRLPTGQCGVALLAQSGWILALVAPAVTVIRFGVIAREEQYLERKFGASYVDYRRRVRRWA